MTTRTDTDRNHGQQRAGDELEIRALHARLLDAWNEADAEAFASPFGDDACFVPFDGSVLIGRDQIAAAHRPLFDRWLKGTRLVDEHTQVRFLGADVALVLAVGGTVMRGKSKPAPARDSIQTLVAVREGGQGEAWSFVSFQNTRIRPIGSGAMSALLWLIPDKLWGLFFRASRTVPRKAIELVDTGPARDLHDGHAPRGRTRR
jgi:uncharacterized protein (TIGR02246 family)